MAVMYDGVNPDSVPAGADVYAGYVNGYWPSYNGLVAKFPNAQHVSITVNSSGTAQVLDVESGDAAAVDVPGWLNRMRAEGVHRPTVYCSRIGAPGYGWQNVIDACHNAGVALPDFWIADYTSGPHPLSLDGINAVAVQWTDAGGYDISEIYDATWPGGSTPTPPTPPTPTPSEENMQTLSNSAPWNHTKHGDAMTFQSLINGKAAGRLTVDGIYGPACADACKNYQQFFGIAADGICGPQTWNLLLHMPLPA